MTAQDLLGLGIIDGIIPEPGEGAHTDPPAAEEALRTTLKGALAELKELTPKQLIDQRYEKFRHMAAFFSEEVA
jgi:acetyl-CoA carboxylase carboxyl transferase subunit alpha